MVQVDSLEARFRLLWVKLGAQSDSEEIFHEIVKRYTEPKRFYHNLNHINSCLQLLDQYSYCADNPSLLETAIWFHDIICNTHRNDNEEKSAEYAAKRLSAAGVNEESITKICDLITATKHIQVLNSKDTALLLDIDLSILGKPEKEFNRYKDQIREEYNWVPPDRYREVRTEILQRFLSRKQIYQTKCLRERFEEQARKNLKESIRKLGLLQVS